MVNCRDIMNGTTGALIIDIHSIYAGTREHE